MNRQGVHERYELKMLGLVIASCAALEYVPGCASHPVKVRQYGEMSEVLGGGAATAYPRVELAEPLHTPHAYAVGALPRLEGEITVLDGRAWIARPDKGHGLRVDGPSVAPAESAAMLTVAHVERWDDYPIDHRLAGDSLEEFIAERARLRGIDLRRPFPFLIEGEVTDLQVHVLNGACPMRPGVRLAANQQPWRFQLETPVRVTVVGFYAADSVGRMTHPGTSIHGHALFDADGTTVTGHVEHIAVAPGAILKLPNTATRG